MREQLLLAGGEMIARGQPTTGGVWFELGALVPSIGVGLLFWFVIRAILRADRREREAERAADRQLRRQQHADADASRPAAAPTEDAEGLREH